MVNGVLGSLSSLFGLSLFGLLLHLFVVLFGAICTLLE
jgi:hypothetical protein